MKELDIFLTTYFLEKAPKMPTNIQEIIVKYGPYLLAISLVLTAIGLLSMFGLGAPLGTMWMATSTGLGAMYQVYMIFAVVIIVLQALALPGLFKHTKSGWTHMLYATIVGFVQSLITMNIAGLIIGSLLSFYILYQIRHHYK